MKKLLLVLFSIIILMGFTSCGNNEDISVDGKDLIRAAQQAYTSLDSAKLTITDVDAGEIEQQFTFRYEGKVLNYLYMNAFVDGQVYYEYNNGKNVQIQKSGEVKTYKWPSKNFKKYKRSSTHPNAGSGIFFFEPNCISEVNVNQADEKTMVYYSYDIEKLSKKMTTETDEGKMTKFETRYTFDKKGDFQTLFETSVFEKDGESVSHTYSIEIFDRNKIDKIENPIKE